MFFRNAPCFGKEGGIIMEYTKTYQNQCYDEERALYGVRNVLVEHCVFDGPADGESALKESKQIVVRDCQFMLRYPFWHVEHGMLEDCIMSEGCRAALWYDQDMVIKNCSLGGIKALRECEAIQFHNCNIVSPEFSWRCGDVLVKDCSLTSEYPFFESKNLTVEDSTIKGKYSFQYVENAVISDCVLDTKDAFWHSRNVTVTDSIVKGEYLGWYAENLKFVHCKIIGTQPLCYAKGLVLEDCVMEGTDLAFEYSDVTADIIGDIVSVKNPLSGRIRANDIGEVVRGDSVRGEGDCEIITGFRRA